MSEINSTPAPVAEEAENIEAVDTGDDIVEAEGEGKPEEAAAPAKPAPASTKKKFNLQVNGKLRDIEVDPSNDEELQKYISKALAAEEKFQEAAMTRKQAETLVEMLQNNPLALLRNPALGLDIRKLAETILNEELEQEMKSPEQKKIEELEQKLKQKEEYEKQLEEQKRAHEMAKLEEQAYSEIENDIQEALSNSNLPRSPYVIKRIADTMMEAVNLGYTDVRVKDIMPLIEEQITGEIQKLFEASPDEVMEKMLGKKRLDNYRRGKVAKQKTKIVETARSVQETVKPTTSDKKEDKKMTFEQMFGKF